jgi:hypothetical protein
MDWHTGDSKSIKYFSRRFFMSRTTSFFIRLIGFLILVGLLVAGGILIYRFGQAQGYAMGQVAASMAEGSPSNTPAVPYAPFPSGAYPYYRPYFGFHPIGGFLELLFFGFLFFFALRLLFRPRFWGYPGMHSGNNPWHSHLHHWDGPPWMKDQPSSEAGDPNSQPSAPSSSGGAEA